MKVKCVSCDRRKTRVRMEDMVRVLMLEIDQVQRRVALEVRKKNAGDLLAFFYSKDLSTDKSTWF